MDLGLTRDCCHEKRKQIDPHGEAGLIEHFLESLASGARSGEIQNFRRQNFAQRKWVYAQLSILLCVEL